MKFYQKIILFVNIGCLLVEAGVGSDKYDNFDVVEFLKKVLQTAPLLSLESNIPPPASLGSVPGVASLGSSPPVASLGSQECRDIATWCSNYKQHCNHPTVKKYCKKTCQQCLPTPVVQKDCIDTHPSCLTGLSYGYCTGSKSQVDFMKKYCQKSCNFCVPEKVECADKLSDVYCARNRGFCDDATHGKYFKQNCAKTCGECRKKKPSFTCGVAKQRTKVETSGLVGGTNAGKGFFPWQVAIYYKNTFMCGGSLIDREHILTAAHCFNGRSKDVREYRIVLGEHNRKYKEGTEQTREVSRIKIHEHYADDRDDNDIALMKMKREANLNDHVVPACLPKSGASLEIGTKCYITGWGKTRHDGKSVDILQKVKVPVVSRSTCERRNNFNFHRVTNKMICTGYDNGYTFISGCHGDSGGPLSCENNGVWTVQGVVSWGSPLCNGLDRYTVFSRISKYISWIEKNV